MPIAKVPAVDVNVCSGWTEQQIDLYNKLDFYFAKYQVERRKTWTTWSKLLGKMRWTPNMGDTMRAVRKEPSPHIRQTAFPNQLSTTPKKDIIDVREVKVDVQVYRHRFETLTMNFIPDFRDFMTNHVDSHLQDIEEKIERFEEIYYRTNIFYNSPYVFFPNRAAGELVQAPVSNGNAAGTDGKTTAWLQQYIASIGNPGNLSFSAINLALTIAENDLRLAPFSGSTNPTDDVGLNDKFCLICSTEAWNQFTFDPWLLANKPIDLDVIHGGFKGSFWGRVTTRLEDLPLRIAADGTFPQPQSRIDGAADVYNVGETVNLPDYNNAPYEVAFLVGAKSYDVIEVGPPPKQFANNGMPKGFGKMFWNAEIELTKNFLVKCLDADGAEQWETNQYGEYLKMISQVTYGIIGRQKRSIIPIVFKRRRGF